MDVPFNSQLAASSLPGDDVEPVELVWRCTECGYQRLAVARPDRCPACTADGQRMVGRTSVAWRLIMRRSKRFNDS
jgi:rubrerythrin